MEVKILTDLCRICLTSNHLIPIFDTSNSTTNQQICDQIMACAAVHVALGDPLPQQICKQCLRALKISHLFKLKCEQMDRQLRTIIQNQSSLTSTSSSSIKSVQINIEPTNNNELFNDLLPTPTPTPEDDAAAAAHVNDNDLYPKINLDSIVTLTSSKNKEGSGNFNPIYTFSNLSKNLIMVSSSEGSAPGTNTCSTVDIDTQIDEFHASFNEIPSYKEEMQNGHEDDVQETSNGGDLMYFDHDDFHLGEECEVIADDETTQVPLPPESPPPGDECEIDVGKEKIVAPKGRYVLIKSVIKPQNIHYVTMNDFRKENSQLIPIKQIKKENNVVEVKSEIPEPAVYVETETIEESRTTPSPAPSGGDEETTSPPPVAKEVKVSVKYKGRGRPKKSDKYKPPHGVSYLKSGRKNHVPVFVRTRAAKRTRYTYHLKDDKKTEIYTKPLPIVKRARVEKIIPPKRCLEEKKSDQPSRKLSTNMLLSDFNKLNDPQKQVLYQRLKLQNFRPTSKKDICERGVPKPLYFVSPKLSEEDDDDDDVVEEKVPRTSSISDDLAIIQQSAAAGTIDQDLKLINGSGGGGGTPEPPAKTGRHTAIKSKRPQKRNPPSSSHSEAQKIEIELKILPRKSERQRSPKKVFPEIDMFTSNSSKRKDADDVDYEIQRNETNLNKFKIKIRRSSTRSTTSSDDDVEKNVLLGDYLNEVEVETESEGKESEGNGSAVKKLLEKEDRVKLDYGAGLSCNVCNKSFPYRSHLIRHVRTHTGLKPYTCEYCKKCFTSLSSLNIHVKNHIGDLPYSCEVCHRGFVQPSVLKRHMLSHTGEHPYQCEICYKTFVHDSSLKTHLKMHTIKEPQHKCDICDKKFKYLSTLTSHLKTHSGIKPFTCPECRKAFYRRSLLTRHMRSHTKERPYKCKLCKARFAYSGGLASHKKLHTGIRPYECDVCSFTFFRMSHLKNHMQKIHNNGVLLNCSRCNMSFDSKPLFKRHLTVHMKRDQSEFGEGGAVKEEEEEEEEEGTDTRLATVDS